MTPVTRGNDTNRPAFTGEVYGINGNGEYQGGGFNNQSAVGSYVPNGARSGALDLTVDGASGNDPGCNCATSVNPNTEFVQEVKVLQSNFGAEHAKGPVALSFVSKQGGARLSRLCLRPAPRLASQLERVVREQGGSGARQEPLRLPRLHAERPPPRAGHEPEPRPRPRLLLPRLRVLPPAPRYGLDPLVGPHRRHARRRLQPGRLARPFRGVRERGPERLPRRGRAARISGTRGARRFSTSSPAPNADPFRSGGFNYVDTFLSDQDGWQALARVDVSLSEATKLYVQYNMQREAQPFDRHALGALGRATTSPIPRPLHGDNRSDSVTVGLTHVFDPSLTSETLLALHLQHRLPERDRRPGRRLPPGRGLSLRGSLRAERRPDPLGPRRLLRQRRARLLQTTEASTPCSSRRSGSGASSRA